MYVCMYTHTYAHAQGLYTYIHTEGYICMHTYTYTHIQGLEASLEAYNKALALEPTLTEAWINIGQVTNISIHAYMRECM